MDNTMLGCQFVISEDFYGINSRCHKLTDGGSCLCPKHQLIVADEARKQERAEEKRKMTKQRKADKLAALAESPLRVIPADELPKGFEA